LGVEQGFERADHGINEFVALEASLSVHKIAIDGVQSAGEDSRNLAEPSTTKNEDSVTARSVAV